MPFHRLGVTLVAMALALSAAAMAQPAPTNQPPAGPAVPDQLKPGDAFGEDVMLPERTVVYVKGHAAWDNAFPTLVGAYKSLTAYLDKESIKPTGPAMTIYTKADDAGFDFNAAVPVAQAPANPPTGDIAVGPAPAGKALKFAHRGSYEAMDSTYEAITNYLDQKGLDAKDLFVEEYVTDILKTPPDDLVVNIYVPLK